jgi:hypothetical protein
VGDQNVNKKPIKKICVRTIYTHMGNFLLAFVRDLGIKVKRIQLVPSQTIHSTRLKMK